MPLNSRKVALATIGIRPSRWAGQCTTTPSFVHNATLEVLNAMNEQQAVLIFLDGTSLPDSVYEQYDLATLEDELVGIVEQSGLGEFDGNEVGPTETILYLYGPDADALFKKIEPVLRANPLCQNARVTIRPGGPGTVTTEVLIPKKA